jgi:methanogenic corrinoid protein MtbC1
VILRFGFETTITSIVYPFLEKIGVLWQTGNITPAQEHFITNLLRQKIIVAIDSLPLAPKSATRVVLFLPEGELHELGLLFYYYVAKKTGFRTYYLGQMVPLNDLMTICSLHDPKIVITAITTTPGANTIGEYLQMLAKGMPRAEILASGQVFKKAKFKLPSNLRLFFSADELRTLLGTLK